MFTHTIRMFPVCAAMLAAALALTALQAGAQTVGHGATATVPFVTGTTLQGGRENLWKAVRWCFSVETANTEYRDDDDNLLSTSTTGATVRVVVQYQKQKHLLCDIVPGGTDVCSWFSGTEFAIDNSGKLDDWHTTLSYSQIPLAAADGSGNRAFSQDGVSGTVTTGDALTALTVDKPGRVVFSKASGSTNLTANGGACR